MLVSFSVANYRSFGEEVTLNMVASNKLSDHDDHRAPIGDTGKYLVKSALIYGANASGKSNLVKAMGFAQRLVAWRQQDRLPNVDFFRFQPEGAAKPSSFEFRFLVNDRVFVYGFDLTSNQILSEWLAIVRGEDELLIFDRGADGRTAIGDLPGRESSSDPVLTATLPVLAKLPLRPHQLFLNRVSSLPDEVQGPTLRAVVRWLTEDLVVLEGSHRSCDIFERLSSEDAFRRFTTEFLQRVNTGVGGLKFEETERECSEWERDYLANNAEADPWTYAFLGCTADTDMRPKPDDPTRVIVRRLLAEHLAAGKKFLLPFCEESDGTQQLLHFMPLLFATEGEGKVFVIDELDRSLHPLLCWEFIRFFTDACPPARKQLVVTTHESHLLNQELLRRDEYWFVEKDKKQQSRLVPLSEFNVRKDLEIRKGYLQGRFGAIPVFGAMIELRKLLECGNTEERDATQESPA
jgi:hypothetical protein